MDPEEIWDYCSWLIFVIIWAIIGFLCCCKRTNYYSCIKKPNWYPNNCYINYLLIFWWIIVYPLLAWAAYRIWSLGGWDVYTISLLLFVINILSFHITYFIYYMSNRISVILIWTIISSIICFANFILFIIEDMIAGLLLLPFLFTIFLYIILSYNCCCINPYVIIIKSDQCGLISKTHHHHHNYHHENINENIIGGKEKNDKNKNLLTLDILNGLK